MFLAGRDRLDLFEDLNDRVHSGIGRGDGGLAFYAQKLDEFGAKNDEGEVFCVKRGQRGQRLDELDCVLPLPIQDELPQKQKVIAMTSVDHSSFSLKSHLQRGGDLFRDYEEF